MYTSGSVPEIIEPTVIFRTAGSYQGTVVVELDDEDDELTDIEELLEDDLDIEVLDEEDDDELELLVVVPGPSAGKISPAGRPSNQNLFSAWSFVFLIPVQIKPSNQYFSPPSGATVVVE